MSEDLENLIQYIKITRHPLYVSDKEMLSFGDWYVDHKLLTYRNVLFCYEYFKDLNRTKAYMRVYRCGYRTANINANRLWKNQSIRELIAALSQQWRFRIGESIKFQIEARRIGLSYKERIEGIKILDES